MNRWKYAVSYAQEAPVTAPLPLCGDLYENIQKAASRGYQGIEVHGRETVEYDYDKINALSRECGAGIIMLVTGRLNTEGKRSLLDDDERSAEAAVEGLKKYIHIAGRLKTDIVIGWVKGVVPSGGDRKGYLNTLAGRLKMINDYAALQGVRVNLEVINHYETNIFNTARETLDFINDHALDNCYVHLDTYHMGLEEFDPYEAIRICGKKLGYFHVADNSRRYPGSGQFDFKRILSVLKEVDYSGYVTLECLPYPDRDTTIIKALEHLKKFGFVNQEDQMGDQKGKSPLHTMTLISPTEFWNDSCSVSELSYAIENGATGGTSNPVIVGQVLKKEFEAWKPSIVEFIDKNPAADEDAIAWLIIEKISLEASKLLKPVYDKNRGRNGRLSIQTNAKYYRNAKAIVEQARHFNSLYPNNNIKLPVTRAGIEAIEELSYQGISVNATVSFTVPQSIAVAEAVERGLGRRQKEGKDISAMSPVCTVMVGRLDDWLKVIAAKKNIITEPGYLEWAGVAAAKKAYRLYRERGYRTRILNAAYRNHYHWSEFIGGDMSMTIPYEWQKKFNSSDVEVKNRIDDPVDPKIIAELEKKFPDFCRAYDEKGMKAEEFEYFGAVRRTLRSFIASYDDLVAVIRNIMISDPDVKGE